MTVAILTEKPDQGRDWAAALGGMSGTFDGEKYIIVSAIGHLFEFIKPGQPGSTINPDDETAFRSWDISNLPWDEKKLSWGRAGGFRVASVIKSLKADLKNVHEIAIATDLDPTGEGDLIAIEIIDELGYATGKKYSRVEFVDTAPESLRKGFKARKQIPDLFNFPDFRKAYYRTRFDYLTMQWVRMATDGTNGVMVKQGRLKTPMVKLIGDQLEAHNNYVRRPYFKSSFLDENGVRYMDKDAPQYESADAVPMNFTESKVILDSREKKTTAPPALLTLSRLSARLATKGYKASAVLDIYQKMYEAKYLSYPRTEDRHITTEQFNEMSHLVDMIAGVVGVDVEKLTHRTARRTHVKDKGAHGANRPGTRVPGSIEEIENEYGACGRAIYEMLAANFLAMYAEDYVFEHQKGHVEKYPTYLGTANVPKSLGWKDIFEEKNDDEEKDEDSSGGLGTMAQPDVFEGAPSRPPHPTQSWLFAQLDKYNIGTGSTQANTLIEIEKPEKRHRDDEKADPDYVLVKDIKGKLTLGELGEYSYALTPGTHIGDLKLTSRIQDNMRMVAEGTLDPEEALAGVAALVVEDMPIMARNAEEMKKVLKVPERRSGGGEVVKGRWNGQEISLFRDVFDHKLTDDELARAFNGEVIEFEATSPKSGERSTHRMSVQEFTYKGDKRVGLRYVTKPKSAGGVPLEFCGYKFTDDEIARFEKGEKIKFGEVFTWPKTGKKGSAALVFDKKTKKLEFAKGVPAKFCGYTFTDDEVARLEAGEEVAFGEVFTWPKSGKKGSATLFYNKKEERLDFAGKRK